MSPQNIPGPAVTTQSSDTIEAELKRTEAGVLTTQPCHGQTLLAAGGWAVFVARLPLSFFVFSCKWGFVS